MNSIPSEKCANIEFIDMITNIMWCKYEDNITEHADCLAPYITCKRLFFK
jgi:hypothetical protein